jgi:hypothetical protein
VPEECQADQETNGDAGKGSSQFGIFGSPLADEDMYGNGIGNGQAQADAGQADEKTRRSKTPSRFK